MISVLHCVTKLTFLEEKHSLSLLAVYLLAVYDFRSYLIGNYNVSFDDSEKLHFNGGVFNSASTGVELSSRYVNYAYKHGTCKSLCHPHSQSKGVLIFKKLKHVISDLQPLF